MATATPPPTAPDIPSKTPIKASDAVEVDITRLTDDGGHEDTPDASRTILHIYSEHTRPHKTMTPTISPTQERRFGPTLAQQRTRRAAKKTERKLRNTPHSFPWLDPDTAPTPSPPPAATHPQTSYFLHTPYLSFHAPPSVLYTTPAPPSRHSPAKPVALIHTSCFWHTYTIQLGASLALPGVLDPRGVVSLAHSAASRSVDATSLRGYRVRGWRLWGESGKEYVHRIRTLRAQGVAFRDPDSRGVVEKRAVAEEVVRLRWTAPLSRRTREYGFLFRGVGFRWKGTGRVSEERRGGWVVRFCHLKIVGVAPRGLGREVCLGTYKSSVAVEKSGMLEIYDEVVEGFVREFMPGLYEGCEEEGARMDWLKKGALYHVIVATALCVAGAEKEKRHTLIDLVLGIAENGGSGGG